MPEYLRRSPPDPICAESRLTRRHWIESSGGSHTPEMRDPTPDQAAPRASAHRNRRLSCCPCVAPSFPCGHTAGAEACPGPCRPHRGCARPISEDRTRARPFWPAWWWYAGVLRGTFRSGLAVGRAGAIPVADVQSAGRKSRRHGGDDRHRCSSRRSQQQVNETDDIGSMLGHSHLERVGESSDESEPSATPSPRGVCC